MDPNAPASEILLQARSLSKMMKELKEEHSEEKKQLKRKIRYLETSLKEKEVAVPDTCICLKRQKRDGSLVDYIDQKETPRKNIVTTVKKFVTAGSKNADETWAKFLTDAVSQSKVNVISSTLEQVLETQKASKVMKFRINKKKRAAGRDKSTKARAFCIRKRYELGRVKKMQLDKTSREVASIKLSDNLVISPTKVLISSASDKSVHTFFKENVPFLPEVIEQPDRYSVKHAFILPEKLIVAVISTAFSNQSVHKNWFWFYKKCPDTNNWIKDTGTLKIGSFLDGFSFRRTQEPAFQNSMHVLNLPGLVHMPQFNFLQAFFNDKEGSDSFFDFLRQYDEAVKHFATTKLQLSFQNYDDKFTVPHCPDVKLNGEHLYSVQFISKQDLKCRLLKHGCRSAKQKYASPDVKYTLDEMRSPDFPVNEEVWVSMEQKLLDHKHMSKFIAKQKEKLHAEVKSITEEESFSSEQKQKKIDAATSRILKKEVNTEAARIKSCCIRSEPTSDCKFCTTCNIHMEPNDWLKFLYKLENISRNATVEHFNAPVLYKRLGKGQKGKHNKGGGLFTPVPDLDNKQCENTPLYNFFDGLKNVRLEKIAKRLKQKYLSTPNTTEEEIDGKSTIPKVRLIGEDVDKLCPNVFQVLGSINTAELKEEFIVMSSYAHLLKCLGSIIGQFSIEVDVDDIGAHFVSEIFVKLAYRFSLPFSLNTFYFAKISPFLFHILKDMFMISPTHTLGLGILGLTQGGEHLNKLLKKYVLKWTSGRQTYVKELLCQMLDVFIGGWCLFPTDFPIDDELDILNPQRSWNKRFLVGADSCFCCGKPSPVAQLVLLKDWLGSSASHKFFSLQSVEADMANTTYKDTHHSLQFLFQRFLRMSLTDNCCTTCASVFQLLYGVFKDKDSLLSFDSVKEKSARDDSLLESESDSGTDGGSDTEATDSEEESDAPPVVEYENPFLD